MTTNAALETTTRALTTGRSREPTALASTRPRPGRVKMFSTSTAPPNRLPSTKPASVVSGSSACRRVCRSSTAVAPRPRERAVSTNGRPSALSSSWRITWASTPASGSASASVGSTSAAGPSAPIEGSACSR